MSPLRPRPPTGRRSVARGLVALAAAGALAGALVTAPAAAVGTGSAGATGMGDALSDRLITLAAMAVTSTPDSGATATDRRSGLAGVDLPASVVADRLSVAMSGPGSLIRDPDGRVLVQARFTGVDEAVRSSLATVGRVVDVAPQYARATLYVAPADLGALAAIPGLVSADVVPAPITSRRAAPTRTAATDTGAADCRSVVSEGDALLGADLARTDFGVDGTGVTVGVVSDSYDHDESITSPAQDVKSGDLPGPKNPCGRTTPVRVLDDSATAWDATDEGRAMLQIVHDLAPGAGLSFATGFNGADSMAANIRALAAAGAGVIVDDVTYMDEPFFQSGVVDQAVEDVTRAGVTYFSSAGNSGVRIGGRDVGSWETPQTRITSCPKIVGVSAKECVNFGTAANPNAKYGIALKKNGSFTVDVQWAEPEYGVSTDFDLYLVDSSGDVYFSSTNKQSKTQLPVEYLSASTSAATSYSLVIVRRAGTQTPRLKLAFVSGDNIKSLTYATPAAGTADVVGPTVFGHNGGAASVSVAAVPYDDPTVAQDYSARGPQTYYLGPVTSTTPAVALPAPEVIAAPDLAAPDGVRTTFFLTKVGKFWRFYGTSAAAPHAAAVAALIRQRDPTLTPAQVTDALQSTARPVGTFPATTVGAGLIDARAAVAAVVVVDPLAVPTVSSVTAGVGRVTLAWASSSSAATVQYAVTCSGTGGRAATAKTSATTATLTGLTAGVTYRCLVRASDGARAPVSATSPAFVPTGKPGQAPSPSVVPKRKRLVLHLSAPAATGGLPVLSYQVVCKTKNAPKRIVIATGRVVKLTKLAPDTRYKLRVRARNAVGQGPASQVVKVRTKA